MNRNCFGTLYIVATPIGNLQDMSLRAIHILKSVDAIAAEDTRHSAPLFQHFGISTPAFSLHEHNERERTHTLLEQLKKGESIALISDAGTPLISDPGYFLVNEARHAGIKVEPIPGACAVIAALCVSGLPTDRFTYEGFLPAKSSHRVSRLTTLAEETRTLVFYESPHRILESLQDMVKVFGKDRQVVLARELTKMYETIHSAPLEELLAFIENDANQRRGEIVLVVAGAIVKKEETTLVALDKMLKMLLEELPLKQAVEIAAKISGRRKNDLYDEALKLKN
jgi:16S rRNA (cytidine1402-2'-O)-methyltransferase